MKAKSKIDMERINIARRAIRTFGWYPFGDEDLECKGLQQYQDFYLRNGRLPHPCDECYKALVFWDGSSKENMDNFFKMLESFEFNYIGKLNKEVVVFYFRDKNKMLVFLDYLQEKMKELDVAGRIQWRRACKEFQDLRPELWKNAKEFIPDMPQ